MTPEERLRLLQDAERQVKAGDYLDCQRGVHDALESQQRLMQEPRAIVERSAIVTHTWLSDATHYERVVRWMNHHERIKPKSWDMIAIDNGSSFERIHALHTRLAYGKARPRIVSFSNEMTRDGLAGYPYTWRWASFMPHFARFWQYDRIVFAESDFFICSQKMLDYATTSTGLSTVYCPKYGFPESAFMVYTPGSPLDTFFPRDDWNTHLGSIIEHRLPWTCVNRELVGDRYEGAGTAPRDGVDFAAQLALEDKIPTFGYEAEAPCS